MESPCTDDTLFGGTLLLRQPARAYRFGVDAVLLGAFAARRPARRCLDACAGSGVVGLTAARLQPPDTHWTFVEVQDALATPLRHNVATALGARGRVVAGDLRHVECGGPFDLIAMNPPWFDRAQGHLPPDPVRAGARFQLQGSVEALVEAAARHLHPEGVLTLLYPAAGLARLQTACTRAGLPHQAGVRLQAHPDRPPFGVLLAAAATPAGLTPGVHAPEPDSEGASWHTRRVMHPEERWQPWVQQILAGDPWPESP